MEDRIIEWYCGHRGNEYPLVFIFAGKEERTGQLISEKLIEERGTRKRIRAFLIKTTGGKLFEIFVGDKVEIKPEIPA